VDDPAGASSQQREECRCGLLLTVEVPAKQVCSPVIDENKSKQRVQRQCLCEYSVSWPDIHQTVPLQLNSG